MFFPFCWERMIRTSYSSAGYYNLANRSRVYGDKVEVWQALLNVVIYSPKSIWVMTQTSRYRLANCGLDLGYEFELIKRILYLVLL
jgi:hypothetical protein